MADICFFDFEGLGPNLPVIGTMNYVTDPRTQILILTFALDDEEPRIWFPGDPIPDDLREHVESGGYMVAWNAAFDRLMWQFVGENDHGYPKLANDQVLCAMAQAQASNLPASLDGAAKKIGGAQKNSSGKSLIKMFCMLGSNADPVDHPERWNDFCVYALDDISSMRDVWQATRPLALEEWQEYWASEKINDRGFEIDPVMATICAEFYLIDKELVAEEAKRLTNGEIDRLTLTARINEYVYTRLPPQLGKTMVTEFDPETGDPLKYTLRKDRLHMLLEDISMSDEPVDDTLVEFLELLEHGRSSSALKFRKMADQQMGGRMYHSYVFNGGGQTGRFSSRGVQVHNLPRERLFIRDANNEKLVVEGEVYELIRETEITDDHKQDAAGGGDS